VDQWQPAVGMKAEECSRGRLLVGGDWLVAGLAKAKNHGADLGSWPWQRSYSSWEVEAHPFTSVDLLASLVSRGSGANY